MAADLEAPVSLLAAPIDEAGLVGLDAAPVSDSALIAWIGEPEPGTKITLQQALTNAPAGGTVHVTPGAYQFTSILTVPKAVTLTAASTTQIFGRVTLSGTSLTTSGIVLSPSANQQSVITVTTASSAVLTDLQIANPDNRTGANLIGVNLASSAAAQVSDSLITKMSTGIAVAAGNTGAGPQISGVTIDFLAKGIALGSSSGASVSSSELTGPGGSGTMGIDYGGGSGASITDTEISGVLAGISTGTLTNANAGPTILRGSITATGNAINLAATTGARVTGTELTCEVPTNNAAAVGVNINNASNVTVTDVVASGFATGIGVTNASTASGIAVVGGDIAAVSNAITLGAAAAPTVSGTTVRGQQRLGVVATTGVNVLNATGATITDLVSDGPRKGIVVAPANTSTGLRIVRGEFTVPAGAATSAIELGGTVGPVVTDPHITGAGRSDSKIGITTSRAQGAVIDGAVISDVGQGITGTWVRLSGTPLAGHLITDAQIEDVGIGIYTANTQGTTVQDVVVDAYGEGIAGHEDADFTLSGATVTGHNGTGNQSSGTNAVRFYYTDGMTVDDLTTVGGSTGLYLDMSYDAVATGLDVSGATWYGTYAESITGYTLQDSYFHDNAGIANLTINPSSLDAIDHRQVSSDIAFRNNRFVDNFAGVYLPLGAFGFDFTGNTVTGTHTFVLYAAPAHDVNVSKNVIDYTHDPSGLDLALELGALPPLGDPPDEPPWEILPPPDIESVAFAAAFIDGEDPPPSAASAIWITPTWFNLDTQSASSDAIAVLDNDFSGDGPFIGVGSVSDVDVGSANAPDDPAAMRALRSTVEVSRNVFPQNSTAIVTVDDAETGLDADASGTFTNGNAAVDARGDNDWGSPCFARVPTDDYDGGGAWIYEVRATQVLYPQGCDPSGGGDGGDGGGDGELAGTGAPISQQLAAAFALTVLGAALLAAGTPRRARLTRER
ncbi:beta strand repeat-containing protein [Demequina sp.]|uniref:beta strand repeat-containing protein n=1 Tax=Demequina sp. TaxID=2050685 RepID=UPI003D150E24